MHLAIGGEQKPSSKESLTKTETILVMNIGIVFPDLQVEMDAVFPAHALVLETWLFVQLKKILLMGIEKICRNT